MATAIVTGLIPILCTAVDASTTYKGRTIWFGFLCIRLVTLFVAEMPWFKLDLDFSCNVTTDDVCTRACFNKHFDKPAVMAWNFIFILLVLSVLLMEVFTSHMQSVFHKESSRERNGGELESLGQQKITCHPFAYSPGMMMLDMHGSRTAVYFYLFSAMLRIVVELCFLYVLVYWNLPKLRNPMFVCYGDILGCPDQECLVRATAEKSMSVYALVFISVLVIIISFLFSLYFIGHYLFNCCSSAL